MRISLGPPLDLDNQRELENLAVPIWQIKALRTGALHSCVNCGHFDMKTEGCELASGQRPPAVVIALGCTQWQDEIPF